MPTENTHLFIAKETVGALSTEIKNTILDNIDYYYLGAVFPDCPMYSNTDAVGNLMHGAESFSPNKPIFEMLDILKISGSPIDFAFIAGYITHCVIDSIFHPSIFYYSSSWPGADKDKSLTKRLEIELYMEKTINGKVFLSDLVKADIINDLIVIRAICELFNIKKSFLVKCLKNQVKFHRLFKNRFAHYLFVILTGLKIYPKWWLACFHARKISKDNMLPEKLNYKDVITGEQKNSSLTELMNNVIVENKKRLLAARRYLKNEISRQEAGLLLSGEWPPLSHPHL